MVTNGDINNFILSVKFDKYADVLEVVPLFEKSKGWLYPFFRYELPDDEIELKNFLNTETKTFEFNISYERIDNAKKFVKNTLHFLLTLFKYEKDKFKPYMLYFMFRYHTKSFYARNLISLLFGNKSWDEIRKVKDYEYNMVIGDSTEIMKEGLDLFFVNFVSTYKNFSSDHLIPFTYLSHEKKFPYFYIVNQRVLTGDNLERRLHYPFYGNDNISLLLRNTRTIFEREARRIKAKSTSGVENKPNINDVLRRFYTKLEKISYENYVEKNLKQYLLKKDLFEKKKSNEFYLKKREGDIEEYYLIVNDIKVLITVDEKIVGFIYDADKYTFVMKIKNPETLDWKVYGLTTEQLEKIKEAAKKTGASIQIKFMYNFITKKMETKWFTDVFMEDKKNLKLDQILPNTKPKKPVFDLLMKYFKLIAPTITKDNPYPEKQEITMRELEQFEDDTRQTLKKVIHIINPRSSPADIDRWTNEKLRKVMKRVDLDKQFDAKKDYVETYLGRKYPISVIEAIEASVKFFNHQTNIILLNRDIKKPGKVEFIYFDDYRFEKIIIPFQVRKWRENFMKDSLGVDWLEKFEIIKRTGRIEVTDDFPNFQNVTSNDPAVMKLYKEGVIPIRNDSYVYKDQYLYVLKIQPNFNEMGTTKIYGITKEKFKKLDNFHYIKVVMKDKWIEQEWYTELMKKAKRKKTFTKIDFEIYMTPATETFENNMKQHLIEIKSKHREIPNSENLYAVFRLMFTDKNEDVIMAYYLYGYNEMYEKMTTYVKSLFQTKLMVQFPFDQISAKEAVSNFQFGVNYWQIQPLKVKNYFKNLTRENYVGILKQFGGEIFKKLMEDQNKKLKRIGFFKGTKATFEESVSIEEVPTERELLMKDVKEKLEDYENLIIQWETLTENHLFELPTLQFMGTPVEGAYFISLLDLTIRKTDKYKNNVFRIVWDNFVKSLENFDLPLDSYFELKRDSKRFQELNNLKKDLEK